MMISNKLAGSHTLLRLDNESNQTSTDMFLDFSVANGATAVSRIGSRYVGSNDIALSFHTFNSSGLGERMRIDKDGNVGIGVSPETHNSLFTSLQIGGNTNISTLKAQQAGGEVDFGHNFYFAASGQDKYISTDEATQFRQGSGQFRFRTAPSGTADAVITFTERMRLTQAGNLGIGTSSPDNTLHIHKGDAGSVSGTTGSGTPVVIENNNHNFIQFLCPSDKQAGLYFGSPGRNYYAGTFAFDEANDKFVLEIDEVKKLIVDNNSRISLSNNDSGTQNTVFGHSAGANIDAGTNYNVFIGHNVAGGGTLNDATENTGVGYSALANLTSGDTNTAIGRSAGLSITTGAENTIVGDKAGDAIGVGNSNTLVGQAAGGALTDGDNNVAIGASTMAQDDLGQGSTAVGAGALSSQNMASEALTKNVGIGYQARFYNVTGTSNSFLGYRAGFGASGQSHTGNIGIGHSSLLDITTGNYNISVGYNAAQNITTGGANIVIGTDAMSVPTNPETSIAIGQNAMGSLQAGQAFTDVIAIGLNAVRGSSSSTDAINGSIGIGQDALRNITTGARNTAIGYKALDEADVCDDSIAIGYQAMSGTDAGACNKNIAIGNYALDGALSNSVNNVAIGVSALGASTSGTANVAIGGNGAGAAITTVSNIVAIGDGALGGAAQSQGNTGVGYASLYNATGAKNTAFGYQSANTVTGGTENTVIGWDADTTGSGAVNQTVIGSETLGVSDNSVTLGNSAVTDVYMAYDKAATVHSGGQVVQGAGNETMWKVVSNTMAQNVEWDTGIDTSQSFMAFVGVIESDNTNGDTAIIACASGTISTVATNQGYVVVNSSTVAANRYGFYSTSNTLRVKTTFANGVDVTIAVMSAT